MVVYRGRIDDTYAPTASVATRPTTRDLRDALDALLAGKTRGAGRPARLRLPPADGRAGRRARGRRSRSRSTSPRSSGTHCGECHRPGEVGPFSLLTYADAAKRADFLRDVVEAGRMPPWKAGPGYGHFLDENRLTRRERAVLDRWADAGAPEGDPADLPPPPKYPDGWPLGEPDLVLTMAEPFTVAGRRRGRVPGVRPAARRAAVDRPIAAVEFRPGNRKVVHHARIFVDETPDCRRRDAADPGPGFAYDAAATTSPSPRSASGTRAPRPGGRGRAWAGRSRRGPTSPC